MKQIQIGTIVPGAFTKEMLPQFLDKGFECLALNFHMDFTYPSLEAYAEEVKRLTDGKDIRISSIGLYCNPLQNKEHKENLEKFIDHAHLFGTNLVTTFAGAIEGDSVDAAMPAFKEVFGELAKRAENKGVKIAFENCPMDGTWSNTTCNIAFNPKAWEMMFHEVPSDALGLEWEPAHQMGQLIDPIHNLKQWVHKVIHVHGKDANIDHEYIRKYGVYGAGTFADYRFPGFGDVDWREVLRILQHHGYDNDICIEGYHDPLYNREWEMTGQLHALNYLKWCRGGDFAPNGWELPNF